MLLAAPAAESLEVLHQLAARLSWLTEPAAELEAVGLAEWQAEHGRLFVCGYPHTPCAPFETAQRRGMMSGPEVEQLAALYRGIGLQADVMPADYLGTMLECAALLDDAAADASAEEDGLWREHLLRWLPDYAQRLQKESRLDLYRQLGAELASACRDHG
jgi:putative dimethyl sulfoxide reductase chaperone